MFQQSKILIIIIIIIKTYVPLIPPLSIINWLLNVHGLVLWLVIGWIKMTEQLSLDGMCCKSRLVICIIPIPCE